MKDSDLIKNIHFVESFISQDNALKIYNYASGNSKLFSDFGNNELEFTVHTHDKIKNNNPELLDLMQDCAKKVYNFVSFNYKTKFEPFIDSATHIAKFSSGQGMHEHFDINKPKDIATLVYLNDNYEGGEIYFPRYNLSFKPKPGDLLTFPDNKDYIHGVKPIISGTRYTTPRWFTSIL